MLTSTLLRRPPAYLRRMESPVGRIEIGSDGDAIISLTIARDNTLAFDSIPEAATAVLDAAVEQLEEYFSGTRRTFDLPLAPRGTEFQQQVWAGLAAVPWGAATSYGVLGTHTGRPTAGRAVGGAVGANPLLLLIPCHRVLAGDGRITGYSGGNGIPTKLWLLDHEGIGYAA